jgi:hypothetical protein
LGLLLPMPLEVLAEVINLTKNLGYIQVRYDGVHS